MRALQRSHWGLGGKVWVAVAIAVVAASAWADLENVVVGGQLRIRGNYWMDTFNGGRAPTLVRYDARWPSNTVFARPIGSFLGGQTLASHFDWDSRGPNYGVVEQRTRLHVRAAFTQDVAAFVELDSFNVWGDDFRSNYLTGIDARAGTADGVDLYQAYLEADNLFGVPLRLRIGRQEMVYGGGWLVGDNSAMPEFTGLSFDGIRATYTHDLFTIDAFWTKLAERSPLEEDGDTDLCGVYGSYKGIEHVTIDAFWFWLRDAAALKDTRGPWVLERFEDWRGIDNYDPTDLHTIGVHAAGTWHAHDFTVNAAYQFGDASSAGSLFKPFVYGDDRARFNNGAADAEVGYTFDVKFKPRVYVAGAYINGEDNRSIGLREWVLNPLFARPHSSISFNRLFSNTVYSFFIDEMGELSNFWMARAGASAHPTDTTEAGLDVAYFGVLDTFDQPMYFRLGGFRIVPAPRLSFWTRPSADDIGWQLHLWFKYQYSADLSFRAGWAHLFAGNALRDGNFNDMNGLLFNGGTGKDDADYLYLESMLKF